MFCNNESREYQKQDINRIIFNFKIHIQTLVPEIKPFENRKPKRQIQLELASFLKNDIAKETVTAKTKSRFNDDTSSMRSSKKGINKYISVLIYITLYCLNFLITDLLKNQIKKLKKQVYTNYLNNSYMKKP